MAVMGIYAKENGQGMVFDAEKPVPTPPVPPKPPATLTSVKTSQSEKKTRGRASLRVVK
jgi:stringent starvation protein B